MTTLNFEFPITEIRCSSFPPPHQLVYSSPVSASFHPSSSMFSILTAFLSLFPVHTSFRLSLSTFTLLTSHLPPHLQAVLTTYPQACVACLCVLFSSIICVRCIHIPPFFSSSPGSALSSSLISVHRTHTPLSSLIYVRCTHHPPCSTCLQIVDV